MLLPYNLKFLKKYFFVNLFRFIIFNFNFLLFLNILNISTKNLSQMKFFSFNHNLNSFIVNSLVLKVLVKKKIKINLLPGSYLILYTNFIRDIISFFINLKNDFLSFIPFALLYKYSFIFLDNKIIKYFIISFKEINGLTLFSIFILIYLFIYNQIFVNLFGIINLILFNNRLSVNLKDCS